MSFCLTTSIIERVTECRVYINYYLTSGSNLTKVSGTKRTIRSGEKTQLFKENNVLIHIIENNYIRIHKKKIESENKRRKSHVLKEDVMNPIHVVQYIQVKQGTKNRFKRVLRFFGKPSQEVNKDVLIKIKVIKDSHKIFDINPRTRCI